jgi:hypothetical protein
LLPHSGAPAFIGGRINKTIKRPVSGALATGAASNTALVFVLALAGAVLLAACGGGSGSNSEGTPAAAAPPAQAAAPAPAASASAPPRAAAVVLKPPVLSFTDTGLSVSDGVTRNGLWSVTSDDLAWEYSLDQGTTWVKGVGNSFEVLREGAQMIWVRTRDDLGNTSETVMVSCVLDTTPPATVAVTPTAQGATRTLQLAGLEAGARWQYALDSQGPWLPGTGAALAVLGNGLPSVWLRQVDIAGNASMPQAFVLQEPGSEGWHEASGNPLQPSVMTTTSGSHTLLIHGEVVRNDADYVRWDIPAQHRLESVRLVHYRSDDLVAFYALQRAAVFDAGVDVTRMLAYGHMGPPDLQRNAVAGLAPALLGAGPVTLWFQQTGPLATRYALEVVVQPQP